MWIRGHRWDRSLRWFRRLARPPGRAWVRRFGEIEVDVRTGEVCRSGRKVNVQDQPLQVLVALLEHPGELVTREELHRRLWPAGTLVDCDHGLNAAVKRLRDALGDSAEQPTILETLPRRGYRLIAAADESAARGARVIACALGVAMAMAIAYAACR